MEVAAQLDDNELHLNDAGRKDFYNELCAFLIYLCPKVPPKLTSYCSSKDIRLCVSAPSVCARALVGWL